MSFLTPQSLASAMTTPFGGNRLTDSNDSSRVQAFKRYISDIESKGGGAVSMATRRHFIIIVFDIVS